MRWRRTLGAMFLAISVGCSVKPRISDTGYVGTWDRGNERVRSVVAIARDGEGYRFRWTKSSSDGKFSIRCGWDGACEERLNGVKVAEYRFAAALDSGTATLKVKVTELRLVPERLELRYVDELVLEPGGLGLVSYTIEKDGVILSGASRPQRAFKKVADGVASPSGMAR